jgi:hypothetical protein
MTFVKTSLSSFGLGDWQLLPTHVQPSYSLITVGSVSLSGFLMVSTGVKEAVLSTPMMILIVESFGISGNSMSFR